MIKVITCAVLVLTLTSCRTYRMLDGKSRPVFFTADSSVFNDPDFPAPAINYNDLLNITGTFHNSIELKTDKRVEAIISRPAFFGAYDNFLVYPGEHIRVTKGKQNDFTFFKMNGSKRRNRELLFFKEFRKVEHYPVTPRIGDASLATVLGLEKQFKDQIHVIARVNKQRFDSLIKAYHVSRKFKRIARNYLINRYDASLFFLYTTYQDTLKAHDLYTKKCKELVPLFNSITNRQEFDNTHLLLNQVVDVVLPYRIWKINNEDEFRSCFDSVAKNFNSLARDYLLSQLMYYADKKSIPISPGYVEKYETACYNKTFKKLIYDLFSQRQQNDSKASLISSNSLLSVDGQKIFGLEDIIAKHKGKLVLVDFWASWCVPCREDLPYLENLAKGYSADKIVFLSVSIDRETQRWQKVVIANNTSTSNNYLLIDAEKSSFMQEHNLQSIPRYFLIDQEGKLVSSDAPRPGDPKLKELLSKHLK